jgi:hypothetical protein
MKIDGVKVPLKNCDMKTLHSITIHTIGQEKMDEFIILLNRCLEETNNDLVKVTDSKIHTNDISENDTTKDLDWNSMPEFKYSSLYENKFSLTLYFPKIMPLDFKEQLASVIGDFTDKTKTAYYGEKDERLFIQKGLCYKTTENIQPLYPIYIISKGRSEKQLTANYLKSIRVPFKVVVEPQEYDDYVKHLNPASLLVLPAEYLNLNQGGIPARNFCLHHSRANGDKRHWILDDNIMAYYRYNDSHRYKLKSGACFRIIEDYVDRYENIYLAGHNYRMFAITSNLKLKAITTNTRIYSSILIQNDIKHEWRGRYNEDTDLSLRVLKDGGRTLLFNCVLADKTTTGRMKGGNTSGIYSVENAMFLKADSLRQQHPDVTKITTRYGRDHHLVDYSGFKKNTAKLLVEDVPKEANEYTMYLSQE